MSAAIKLCVDRYRYIEKRPHIGSVFFVCKKVKFVCKSVLKVLTLSVSNDII